MGDEEEEKEKEEDYDEEEEDDEEYDFIKVSIKHKIKECYKGKIRYVPNIDINWVDQKKLDAHEEKLQIQQPSPSRNNLNHDDNNKSSSSSSTTKITTRIRYLEEVKNKLRANKKVR